jgi:hypothetical protein
MITMTRGASHKKKEKEKEKERKHAWLTLISMASVLEKYLRPLRIKRSCTFLIYRSYMMKSYVSFGKTTANENECICMFLKQMANWWADPLIDDAFNNQFSYHFQYIYISFEFCCNWNLLAMLNFGSNFHALNWKK